MNTDILALKRMAARILRVIPLVVIFAAACAEGERPPATDPHYTKAGYFDMHVCNWPDRPLFFVALLTTKQHRDIAEVAVMRPDGVSLGNIDLSRSEPLAGDGDVELRTFKTHIQIPPGSPDGWYMARIRLKNGSEFLARDYVNVRAMPPVTITTPLGDDTPMQQRKVAWRPLPQTAYYRVIIKDPFQDKKIVYKSDLLTEPQFTIPPGILEKNGAYILRIHARNASGDPKWGDFNHGSMNAEVAFTAGG